jgi:hypothetical protein
LRRRAINGESCGGFHARTDDAGPSNSSADLR